MIRGLTSLEGEVTARQFVELIERMITVDRKLTRAELEQMIEQRSGSSCSLTISPRSEPASDNHEPDAPWLARHKVRHEARGSVEHPYIRPMV